MGGEVPTEMILMNEAAGELTGQSAAVSLLDCFDLEGMDRAPLLCFFESQIFK